MTLRDLTKHQLYNLQRRCEKERKEKERLGPFACIERELWNAAFSKGLKAGLEHARPSPPSPD